MAKKPEAKEAEVVEVKPAHDVNKTIKKPEELLPKKVGWNAGRIFWGLLLVVVGALILANNFGWVDVHWDNLWRLWPLMIVAAGLSVLSLRNWVWRLITTVFVILALGAVILVSLVDYGDLSDSKTYKTTSQKLSNDVNLADITVKAGASRINVDTTNQDAVVEAKLNSSFVGLNQQVGMNGNTQVVTLSMEGRRHWWRGNSNSVLDVNLTRKVPVKLALEIGASDTHIDLSKAKVHSVNVRAGASSVVLRLGDLLDNTAVDISSGVSSIVLQVPASSGVRAEIDGGLASRDMADLIELGDVYESSNYGVAAKKIIVIGSFGLASFTIERY